VACCRDALSATARVQPNNVTRVAPCRHHVTRHGAALPCRMHAVFRATTPVHSARHGADSSPAPQASHALCSDQAAMQRVMMLCHVSMSLRMPQQSDIAAMRASRCRLMAPREPPGPPSGSVVGELRKASVRAAPTRQRHPSCRSAKPTSRRPDAARGMYKRPGWRDHRPATDNRSIFLQAYNDV
jgi:hypothetical protein